MPRGARGGPRNAHAAVRRAVRLEDRFRCLGDVVVRQRVDFGLGLLLQPRADPGEEDHVGDAHLNPLKTGVD